MSLFSDQFDKVKKYYQESTEAEQKCNASVSGPLSPVEQSNQTRALTEELLEANREKFLQSLAAQNQTLDELQEKTKDLDDMVQNLSQKVGTTFVGVNIFY